jgi:hypothetical protein
VGLHVIPKLSIMRRIRTIAELGTVNAFLCTQEIQKFVDELKLAKNPLTHAAYIAGAVHGIILRSRKENVLEDMVIPLIDRAIEEREK